MRRLALAVAAALFAAACGGGATVQQASPLDNATPPSKPVEVTFWHGFAAGANQDATNALVQKFNDAHKGDIHVTATYQGTYDDTLAKLKAAIQANQPGTLRSLSQIYDIGTRFMIDSKAIQPIQAFIDHDKFSIADLEPNILGYYSIGGKLYSMPWNISTPLLYYNKDAFREAGLDPEKPPQTLDEIRAAAEKLTKKDGSGNVTKYGFGAAIYGWFLEQLTAKADLQFCNNGNGRDKNASTERLQGRAVRDEPGVDRCAARLPERREVPAGRRFLSRSRTNAGVGGAIPGGASLWIMNGKPSYEQKAAWEFVKFLEQPDNMAYWHTHTGYFPVDKKALNDPTDLAWVQQYLLFRAAIDQLHATRLDKATQGCLLGVMPQTRQAAEVGIENAILKKASPQKAMDDAAAAIQPQIDQYNQAVAAR